MKQLLCLLGVTALFLQACGGQDPELSGLDGDKGDSGELTLSLGRFFVTMPASAKLRGHLELAAGQTIAVVARSSVQPALNSTLWLSDSSGETLSASNPNAWQASLPMADLYDSFIVFSAPQAGRYTLECKNLGDAEGDFALDIIVLSQQPPVDLTVTDASIRGIFAKLRQAEQELSANTSLQLDSEPVDLFASGLVSEGAGGLLQENASSLSLKAKAALRSLLGAINADRQALFETLSWANDQQGSTEQTGAIGSSLAEIYLALRSDS